MNKTFSIKKADIKNNWILVNADNEVLGRLSTKIVAFLTGKNKPTYTPTVFCGDNVVVVNSEKVKLTGNKEQDKLYRRHSGKVGNLQENTADEIRRYDPNRMIFDAVNGMLPKNRLRKVWISKLYIYKGNEHPHKAQIIS
jgi:large subunit ribosomal protein L13